MDFSMSDRQREWLTRMTSFINTHIRPAVGIYNQQVAHGDLPRTALFALKTRFAPLPFLRASQPRMTCCCRSLLSFLRPRLLGSIGRYGRD
jgi:hypothetical protein